MLTEWLRRTFRRLPYPPASRDQWTIGSVHFDTTGWRLTEASATSMNWVNDRGATMTLTKGLLAAPNPHPIDLDAARRAHRARAAAANAGILSVEPALMPNARVALEVLTKRPRGLGYGFEGLLAISQELDEYSITITADEALTGMRESVVSVQMWQLGELDMAQVTGVPAEPSTGARNIPGWAKDPYDPAYDDGALHTASDDPRLDPLFPEHPLTIIRAALFNARTTWDSGAQPEAQGFGATLPQSPGPRVMLSGSTLREIYWAAGRNDLLEPELSAAISSVDPRGDSRDAEVARLLMMLGLVQHNSQNFLNANVTLLRARDILTTAVGENDRQTGLALALLGRTQARLGRLADAERSFRRAIAILQKAPGGGLPLLTASAQLGEMLTSQNRVQEAVPLIELTRKLLADRPPEGGPALLREFVGGAPPAVTARIKLAR